MSNNEFDETEWLRKAALRRKLLRQHQVMQAKKIRARHIKIFKTSLLVLSVAGAGFGICKFLPQSLDNVAAVAEKPKNSSYDKTSNTKRTFVAKNFQKKDSKLSNFKYTAKEHNVKKADKKGSSKNFVIGGNESDNVSAFMNGSEGQILQKYSKDYGVPAYLIAAMCMQESSLQHSQCCPGGDMYNGFGVGIMQLESPSGEAITAYNCRTEQYDTVYNTMDNACDIERNIQIGCMIFQNSLNRYNGNVILAIQSHNYGSGMLDSILETYCNDLNKKVVSGKEITVDDIKNDYSNVGWIDYIADAHDNPLKYISNWKGSYGDGKYIDHVLSRLPETHSKITYTYLKNNTQITFDLSTKKCLNRKPLNIHIVKSDEKPKIF